VQTASICKLTALVIQHGRLLQAALQRALPAKFNTIMLALLRLPLDLRLTASARLHSALLQQRQALFVYLVLLALIQLRSVAVTMLLLGT
jgi:hypothetical protein